MLIEGKKLLEVIREISFLRRGSSRIVAVLIRCIRDSRPFEYDT